MPTGKRASMREGPLAALFRRTTDDPPSDSPAADAPPPTGSAGRDQPGPDVVRPDAEQAEAGGTPEAAAAPQAEAPIDLEQPRIPTPQERLRHAFSSDIPESLLDRPA